MDPDGPLAALQPQAYFEERLPRLLLKALGRVPERFDALLVDEGQDFTAGYWRSLQRLLADPAAARVYVFRDEAQDVFGGGAAGAAGDGPAGPAAGREAGLLEGVPECDGVHPRRGARAGG